MTDNDIIKEKEHFQHIVYSDGFSLLEKELAKVALMASERIEQQKKDIDFFRKRADVCFVCLKQEENDRLRKELKTAKADAFREFAERLKERQYLSSEWSHGEHPYVIEEADINEILLEEMTEDES